MAWSQAAETVELAAIGGLSALHPSATTSRAGPSRKPIAQADHLAARIPWPYVCVMFERLLSGLLAPSPARLPEPDARLAMAALMVRVARSDGTYTDAEISHIDRVLAQLHGISAFAAAALRAEAEVLEGEAPDTVRFTRAIKAAIAHEDRAALLQALWSVALSDGSRDAEEDRLLRLVANLLGLTDVESALARRRAAEG